MRFPLRFITIAILPALLWPAEAHAGEGRIRRPRHPIPGQYIVVLNDAKNLDIAATAKDVAQKYGGTVETLLTPALNGFLMEMSDQRALVMSADPRIRYVD